MSTSGALPRITPARRWTSTSEISPARLARLCSTVFQVGQAGFDAEPHDRLLPSVGIDEPHARNRKPDPAAEDIPQETPGRHEILFGLAEHHQPLVRYCEPGRFIVGQVIPGSFTCFQHCRIA